MNKEEPKDPVERYWYHQAGEEYKLRCAMMAERDEALSRLVEAQKLIQAMKVSGNSG